MNRVASRTGGRPRRSDAPETGAEAGADDRLVRERDALLHALDEIEDERASGDLDDATYERVRNDYVARIAALQRALQAGRHAPRPARARRRVVVGLAVLVAAVVVGVVLATTLGTRDPGGSLTGNSVGTPDVKALAKTVEQRPDDAAARLAYARALMATDRFGALKQFDEAARLAPNDPESRAYGGWILFLLSRSLPPESQATAIDAAQQRLEDAVAVAPGYPDARFFLGLLLLRARNDAPGAVAQFDEFLALAPDAPMAAEVRAARDEAVAAVPR